MAVPAGTTPETTLAPVGIRRADVLGVATMDQQGAETEEVHRRDDDDSERGLGRGSDGQSACGALGGCERRSGP